MRGVGCSVGTVLGLIAAICSVGVAAENAPSGNSSDLVAQIRRAAERPPDPQQAIVGARDRLLTSVQRLERHLARGGAESEQRWREWLDLPALKSEVERPEPDVARLRSVGERYYQNQPGLELPTFLAVREELHGYLAAREYATAASPQNLFRERLGQLAECLARLDAEPSDANAKGAGPIVAWMAALSEEGAELAKEVRARYCRPNGIVQISKQFVNLLLGQDVEERNFISDFIFGSYTHGPSFTRGRVSFGMVPNQQQGTLEVRLEGQNACPANIAQRGRVSVYSSAQTTIRASKQVYISDQGLTLVPAMASCFSSVQINDVEARSRILERISWRRANQLLPQAEGMAARRAEAEASGKLDERANAALGGVNQVFCEKIRAPLLRLGALPTRLQFWTDSDYLRLSLTQYNGAQLAAATAAPQLPLSYDLGGSVHESMLNNLCETLLKRSTVSDQAWLDLVNLITGTAPRPLWVHDRMERWSVTFGDERPILARFSNDRLGFTLRLARINRGTRQFEGPIEIEAQFVPQITRDGPALVRDGDVKIRFANDAGSEDERQWRDFLTRKFTAVFPGELRTDGLVPPTGGSLGKLRKLQLVEFTSARGWLTLGYELGNGEIRGTLAAAASSSPGAR